MSWVKWLKDKTGRRDADEGPTPPVGRRPRKGGEAYAKEWVKVLEDTDPAADPFGTYAWELKPDATAAGRAAPQAHKPKPAAKAKPAPKPAQDEFDTYSWELQETDSQEDPWGLQRDAAKKPEPSAPRAGGVNPYDTGVFNATWTGRFDQR